MSSGNKVAQQSNLSVLESWKVSRLPALRKWHFVPKKYGNTYLLCGRADAYFPLICWVGSDWSCMLLTYTLIIGVPIIFLYFAAFRAHPAVGAAGAALAGALVLAFSLTACSDPGALPPPPPDEEKAGSKEGEEKTGTEQPTYEQLKGEGFTECAQCDMMRPKNASHCYDCGLCIEQLDHHCPWTGKCIGHRNLKFFYSFVTLLCINIGYIFIGVVWYVLSLVE